MEKIYKTTDLIFTNILFSVGMDYEIEQENKTIWFCFKENDNVVKLRQLYLDKKLYFELDELKISPIELIENLKRLRTMVSGRI